MPLAFPSHQGLIAPLWRRWPKHFDALALCVGAAAPDIVDGITGPFRGGLGQWYGHSLFGLFVFCWPLTVLLTLGFAPLAKRWLIGEWNPTWRVFLISSWLGAFSHLFIDFLSHGNFLWFFPWYTNPHFFPSWWYIKWGEISLPGYRNPYPFGPHLIVWIVFGVVGIIMFFWPWLKPRKAAAAP